MKQLWCCMAIALASGMQLDVEPDAAISSAMGAESMFMDVAEASVGEGQSSWQATGPQRDEIWQ